MVKIFIAFECYLKQQPDSRRFPQSTKFQQILNSENAFCVQVTVALFSILFLFILSSSYKFVGIWVALTIYMSLRALAGFWRYVYMINC